MRLNRLHSSVNSKRISLGASWSTMAHLIGVNELQMSYFGSKLFGMMNISTLSHIFQWNDE